jgi:hypothetical protein
MWESVAKKVFPFQHTFIHILSLDEIKSKEKNMVIDKEIFVFLFWFEFVWTFFYSFKKLQDYFIVFNDTEVIVWTE